MVVYVVKDSKVHGGVGLPLMSYENEKIMPITSQLQGLLALVLEHKIFNTLTVWDTLNCVIMLTQFSFMCCDIV